MLFFPKKSKFFPFFVINPLFRCFFIPLPAFSVWYFLKVGGGQFVGSNSSFFFREENNGPVIAISNPRFGFQTTKSAIKRAINAPDLAKSIRGIVIFYGCCLRVGSTNLFFTNGFIVGEKGRIEWRALKIIGQKRPVRPAWHT